MLIEGLQDFRGANGALSQAEKGKLRINQYMDKKMITVPYTYTKVHRKRCADFSEGKTSIPKNSNNSSDQFILEV